MTTNGERRDGSAEDGSVGSRRETRIDGPPASVAPHEGTGRVVLRFAPSGREVRVPPGVAVFDAASWNGIAIDSTCGGHGTCRKCKVQLTVGTAPVTSHDRRTFTDADLASGWRLACLINATSDLSVTVPPLVTRPKAATVGVGRQVILRPAVQKRFVELTEPDLADQRTDLQRLLDAVDDLDLRADLHALRRLPKVLRASDFKVTAVIVDEALIDVEGGDTTAARYGLAFDLGTTTVVATLVDLSTGTPLAVSSMLNKQQPFGGDVITRISATMMDPEALGRLRQLAHETLAELADQVFVESGLNAQQVYEVALAGNATMTALLFGVDPEPLGVAPFIMSASGFPVVPASEIGLQLHPGARVFTFPALGAYVGGDIVAGMLATGMDRDKRAEGAIEVVRFGDDEEVHLGVIGDCEPVGLCGSGLVDAVAELVRVGLLDTSGRFLPDDVAAQQVPHLSGRLTAIDKERVFILHRPHPDAPPAECVYLSQRDIRELQFAKAAIATGWSLLLEELGLCPTDVQQVLLAGSFGSYLSPAAAIRIGLVPKLPVLRIISAGNVAGEGAKMVLLSARERAGAATLLEEVQYLELSDRADFNDRFIEQLSFPG